jgi:AcrR family transcriptional regulator
MADNNVENNLKQRLILAGLKELEEHGIKEFSLRRVATVAEVSCAAPYRHFKNKEELISAIIEYIKNDWSLLCEQIEQVFLQDECNLIKELSASCVRFWIANGNFLSVLFLLQSSTDPEQKKSLIEFDNHIITAINKFFEKKPIASLDKSLVISSITSLIYGTIMLITRGSLHYEDAIINMKKSIDYILK